MSSVYKPSFGAFDKDTKFAKIQPPLCHMIGRVTGGLAMLYRKIKTKQIHSQQELHYEYGSCTEENGVFNPGLIEEVPLLGKRYEYSKVIGSGISSVLVQAVDTYRQNQYQVAIKILHTDYKMLGCQEADTVLRLNRVDPSNFSRIIRLLNTFTFDGHFCMVYELLHPSPLHLVFSKKLPKDKSKSIICKNIRGTKPIT
ncbi:dual specificity protein kinase CLK1-like isoform X1 [Anneissia japonica]|uniref:dual specificity protein kinase CLK1-like isoform X1 n=1 Tax=Anneissia japonica TaxID=1529436 RepID=UPI0014255B96|nr:dual specificity protein kinase CLK1-like isoform X1 [Anneissia japonica]